MDAETPSPSDVQGCRAVLLQFLRALDGVPIDVSALLTADAELGHRGRWLRGHAEIAESFRQRAEAGAPGTVHVLANDVAHQAGPEMVTIDALLLVYERGERGTGVVRSALDTRQVFVASERGWLIHWRETCSYPGW